MAPLALTMKPMGSVEPGQTRLSLTTALGVRPSRSRFYELVPIWNFRSRQPENADRGRIFVWMLRSKKIAMSVKSISE